MFSKFFIERPRFAIVISIILSLAGIISSQTLPISLFPEIAPPTIRVSASYPGASSEVVANSIGIPLEEAINGVEGMIYMDSSSSSSGSYSLTVTFEVGVDGDMAQVNVQNRLQEAMSQLPTSVQQQGLRVRKASSDTLGFVIARSPNNTMSPEELLNYTQNNVKNNLIRVDGVGSVDVYAAALSMRIWLDADKITALNLPLSSIRQAIESQNILPSLGKIGAMPTPGDGQMVYNLISSGRINDVDEFKEIIVRTAEEGGLVRLKDIAKVEIGQEDYTSNALFNGGNSVAISISLLSGANALSAMDNLKAEMQRLAQNYPDDYELIIAYDATNYIMASIKEVLFTIILTFLLVMIVCYVFLQDWRATLIPVLTIPVSLLATLAVLLALGYSINILTLFGLVLAIGLVVDDAIVVVERVLFIMEHDKKISAKQATINAMEEITGAIIATTLVLLAIFVPIGFLGGITGRIYQQFAVSISTAVFFSSVNALTLSPALCATILKPLKPFKRGPLFRFSQVVDYNRDNYAGIVGIISRKVSAIALSFGLIVCCIFALLQVSQSSFIPAEDQGVIMGSLNLPEGASIDRTEAFIEKISPIIRAQEGVVGVLSVSGRSMISGVSENLALLVIILETWDKRTTKELYSTNILNKIRMELNKFPEAEVNLFEPPAIMGLGNSNGLSFQLQSKESFDAQKLDAALQGFLSKLNSQPYLNYSFSSYNAKTPHIFVSVNRDKAELMKISVGSLYDTIGQYLGSSYINDVNFGTQVNQVIMQSAWPYRANIKNIDQLYVQNSLGKQVPLGGIVETSKVLRPSTITRYNQYPSASITSMVSPEFSSGEAMAAMEKLAEKTLPKGYGYAWSGMSYQEKTSQGQIGFLLTLAIIFAYLFLVAQYESWSLPIPVIASVSIAMVGALLGLFLHNLPLSIYAQLGLVLLVGLASKNAILIIEFAKEEHEKGATIAKAAMIATKERFRAVLMTAFTFILGTLPLILASGAAANSRKALGVPVFYGMLVGTIAGLILIPLLYVLVQTITEKLFSKKEANS